MFFSATSKSNEVSYKHQLGQPGELKIFQTCTKLTFWYMYTKNNKCITILLTCYFKKLKGKGLDITAMLNPQ